jgi:hypothetical protein
MNGRILFACQGSGKTTKHLNDPVQFIDVEQVIAFNKKTIDSELSFELNLDLTHFFFEHVLPIALFCAANGKVCMINLVTPHFVWILEFLLRGLASNGYDIQVFALADQSVLEQRIATRNAGAKSQLLFARGGTTYVLFNHLLLRSFVTLHSRISLVHEVTTRAKSPTTAMFRYVCWTVGAKRHKLIESSPGGLFIETVDDLTVGAYEFIGDTFYCMKNTKQCVHQHFDCQLELRVVWSRNVIQVIVAVGSTPLEFAIEQSSGEHYVPKHKLRPSTKSAEKTCVLALYGSFAPMHKVIL